MQAHNRPDGITGECPSISQSERALYRLQTQVIEEYSLILRPDSYTLAFGILFFKLLYYLFPLQFKLLELFRCAVERSIKVSMSLQLKLKFTESCIGLPVMLTLKVIVMSA